jgi:hypothetical protein
MFNLFKNNLLMKFLKASLYSNYNTKISQSNDFKFLYVLILGLFVNGHISYFLKNSKTGADTRIILSCRNPQAYNIYISNAC